MASSDGSSVWSTARRQTPGRLLPVRASQPELPHAPGSRLLRSPQRSGTACWPNVTQQWPDSPLSPPPLCVQAAVEAAAEAPKNSGFFGAFAGAFEAFLKVLDDGLEKLNVPYRCDTASHPSDFLKW